jgi:hypothetical protein
MFGKKNKDAAPKEKPAKAAKPAKVSKAKKSRPSSGKSGPNFFAAHIEKIVLVGALGIVGVLVALGFSKKGGPES